MHHSQPCILSLSLSRNRLGFAIFRYGSLIYYGGKTLRRYGNEAERRHGVKLILQKLIERHQVTALLLPQLNKQQQHSVELRRIHRYLDRVVLSDNLPIQHYDPVYARSLICNTKRPTKENTAQILATHFPDLNRYAQAKTDWERRYYSNVFTAVAGGVAYGR